MHKSKSKPEADLFFVAVVPPAEIAAEVTAIKEEIARRYGSSHALKSPPHVTLHMPFRWRTDRVGVLRESMAAAAQGLAPVSLALRDFACFAPRVIYVDVEHSDALHALRRDLVRQMRRDLKLLNADYKDLPFHPHMTLAFRDLNKARFAEAWADFSVRSFAAAFVAERLTVLRHTGEHWEVWEEFALGAT